MIAPIHIVAQSLASSATSSKRTSLSARTHALKMTGKVIGHALLWDLGHQAPEEHLQARWENGCWTRALVGTPIAEKPSVAST